MTQNLREWFASFLQRVRESNDEELVEEISALTKINNNLVTENIRLVDYACDTQDQVDELTRLLAVVNKYDSLENYQVWLENNVKPVVKYYDFGTGRKQVHTIFAESIKDVDIIREFIETDLGFDPSIYATADELVYEFNIALSKKCPTSKYYDSDTDLYGMLEYWATAKETIEKLRLDGKSFDCDDSMTLRYSCLYHMLSDYFPDEIWRLRGFIVDIWTGGGHAMLAWVKEGVNDWVPIETTFYDVRNAYIWEKDYRIREQMLYQIRYSFDKDHEYAKI